MEKTKLIISFLKSELNVPKTAESKLDSIVNKLLKYPLFDKTELEFSLRIKNNKILDSLRFVNFDNYSYQSAIFYKKRLDLIENILNLNLKNNKFMSLIGKIRYMGNSFLPMYFGIETIKSDFKYKLYLNFSVIKDIFLRRIIVKIFLKLIGMKDIKIKKREFPLICFDFSQNGEIDFKIYYLYSRIREMVYLKKYNFNNQEKDIFNFLNRRYNKNNFFVIAERYNKCRYASRKIEIGIKESIDYRLFLYDLLAVADAVSLYRKIKRIIEKIDGKINVVIVEKNALTIYIRHKK